MTSSISKTPSLVKYWRLSTMTIAERKLITNSLKSFTFGKIIPRNPNGVNIMIFPKTLMKIVFQTILSLTKLKVETIGSNLTVLKSY